MSSVGGVVMRDESLECSVIGRGSGCLEMLV